MRCDPMVKSPAPSPPVKSGAFGPWSGGMPVLKFRVHASESCRTFSVVTCFSRL